MTDEVTITVEGDVGCGKSIILARIAQILRDEFGATVNDECLAQEYRSRPNDIANWEKDSIKNTFWTLEEKVKHGKEALERINANKL